MDWKDVGKTIAEFAPTLGRVVGNFVPGAQAVGAGIGLLASVFGVDENDGPDTVLKKITMDPDHQVKLAEIESRHRVELQKLVIEQERIYLADVNSARLADVEKTKATGKRDVAMYVLAAIIVVGFFSVTALLMFVSLPQGASQAVFLLLGTLGGAFASVVGYFFGSSKSSADKTEMLKSAATK